MAKKREPKLGNLDETNYREYAQAVIAKYGERDMIVDAMLWGQIIRHYENALGAKVDPVTVDAPAHPLGCACGGPLCGQRPEVP